MDYEDKEMNVVKPPFGFSAMLYLFFTLVVWMGYSLLIGVSDAWQTYLEDMEAWQMAVAACLEMAVYVYAFFAVVMALKRKAYGVAMLKFSVFYLWVILLFKMLDHRSEVVRYFSQVFGLILLAVLLFGVYLFRSKALAVYIPKGHRCFGLAGSVGVLIAVGFVSLYGFAAYDKLQRVVLSEPVPVSRQVFGDYRYTDGACVFVTPDSWVLDTIVVSELQVSVFYFKREEGNPTQVISFASEEQDRLSYYQYLHHLREQFLPDTLSFTEHSWGEERLDVGPLYYDVYTVGGMDRLRYWTFAVLFAPETYKAVALSLMDKDSLSFSEAELVEFMKNVQFDLEQAGVAAQEGVDDVENTSYSDDFESCIRHRRNQEPDDALPEGGTQRLAVNAPVIDDGVYKSREDAE